MVKPHKVLNGTKEFACGCSGRNLKNFSKLTGKSPYWSPFILKGIAYPADTDVFKTSSGRLKKVAMSYHQTRRRQDVWKKMLDLWRLEDVWFTLSWRRPIYDVLKTSNLRRPEDIWLTSFWDVQFRTSWKRLIYDVSRTSGLRRLEDVRFSSSWRRPIYDVLKTSDLWRLEDVWFITFWRCL